MQTYIKQSTNHSRPDQHSEKVRPCRRNRYCGAAADAVSRYLKPFFYHDVPTPQNMVFLKERRTWLYSDKLRAEREVLPKSCIQYSDPPSDTAPPESETPAEASAGIPAEQKPETCAGIRVAPLSRQLQLFCLCGERFRADGQGRALQRVDRSSPITESACTSACSAL